MIKTILIDFLGFLRRPNDEQINLNFQNKLKYLFILLLFEIIFLLIIVLPLNLGIDKLTNIKESKFDYSDTLFHSVLLMVVIIPLFEELIFRYILRYQGFKTKFLEKTTRNYIFPFLVYGLSISFGLLHISNYLNEDKLFLFLSPLIIISQLFGGFIITFIRVRLNFVWGVFYHWVWNFLFVIFIPIIENQFSKPFAEYTSNHNITISEQVFFNKEVKQTLKIDTSNTKLHKVKINQYSLQHVLDTIYGKDKYYVDDVLINLHYNSKDGMTKEEFLELIRKEYEIE